MSQEFINVRLMFLNIFGGYFLNLLLLLVFRRCFLAKMGLVF